MQKNVCMNKVFFGDCRESMKQLIADGVNVQICVTSPPYWGLRDYGTAKWDGGDAGCDHQYQNGGRNPETSGKQLSYKGTLFSQYNHECKKCGARRVDSQLGIENSPEEYVQNMVEVFRLVRELLKDDGTLWLNLGDSYYGSWRNNGSREGGRRECIAERLDRKAWDNNTDRPASSFKHGSFKPKDLVGIPWRVAFALQQPYVVPTCVKNETDKAWLAAMFDGEGCIGIRRFDSYRKEKQQVYQDGFAAYTVVTNNDIESLEKCVAITGKGKVALKQSAGSTDGRGIVSRRDSYGWQLDGNDAIDVIRAVYPYLIAKKKQSQLAFTLDTINKDKHRVDGKVPKEDQDKKIFCYEAIKLCNQRQLVELPKWIQEPKQKIEDGWYLRSDIIWHKPNPAPESVTDRPTKSHEYLFLMSKRANYYYDADAIKEDSINEESFIGRRKRNKSRRDLTGDPKLVQNFYRQTGRIYEKRNRRSVWTIPTASYSGAHFAVFPKALVEPCILAGSKIGDVVLDPFIGSGTVGEVCQRLGRKRIGFELNEEYGKLQEIRTAQQGLF